MDKNLEQTKVKTQRMILNKVVAADLVLQLLLKFHVVKLIIQMTGYMKIKFVTLERLGYKKEIPKQYIFQD